MLSWQSAHELAMSMPEAEERNHFGSPSFLVKGKIFAQLSARGKEDRALVKLSAADQAALTMSDPDTFHAAPTWGRHGWTYIQLRTVEESMLRRLLMQSWRLVAPRKTLAALDALKKSD